MKPRAIISVSDKKGLTAFAKGLEKLGFEILSTGGTAQALQEAGIVVKKVSDATAFPEILGGRVKTLHPNILGGMLARMDVAQDLEDLKKHQIAPVALVCVNLYPFAKTIEKPGVPLAEAVEQIDVGGPTMIRAAAKNYPHVTVVVDPEDYETVLAEMQKGNLALERRFALARKAFTHTALYDATISQYLTSFSGYEAARFGQDKMDFPQELHQHFSKVQDLRYGENPHQPAAYYEETSGKARFHQLHGKELSFNNILDGEGALRLLAEFKDPAAVVVKHTNPCGAAVDAKNVHDAYRKAFACDSLSAFGGIVAVNRAVDRALAEELSKTFLEVILAPEFHQDAIGVLTAKKNVRLMTYVPGKRATGFDCKRVAGGLLVQRWDQTDFDIQKVKGITKRKPSATELQALDFAWRVVRHVKSNAIVLAKGTETIGIGAGQMSRVDSTKVALAKAKEAKFSLSGAVLASDAFFPFRDSIDVLAESGITAVIQPGGSVRDDEVIQAADEHQIAMVFTEMRHFRH